MSNNYPDTLVNWIGTVLINFTRNMGDLTNICVQDNWGSQTGSSNGGPLTLDVGSNGGDDPNSPGWPQQI